MLKIYTDHQFITEQYRSCVFPLLFDLCYSKNLKLAEKYQIIYDINHSDIVIVPIDINNFFINNKTEWLYNFIDNALKIQKKVWIYSGGDYGYSINRPVFTFRLGGFNSQMDKQTFIMPSFISDPYDIIQKEFNPIAKNKIPEIGFVGHASNSKLKWGKEFLIYLLHIYKRITKQLFADFHPFYPSTIKRYEYLRLLQKSDLIKTNFIFRNKYRAGVKTEFDRKKTTLDFFENIASNPYTFCARGVGNFSVRLYETLAMGRIPFVIDTDFRLPLEGRVNWEKYCVIVKEENVCEALIAFHEKISDIDFEKMQIDNRNLWLNCLNREAYFSEVYSLFKEKL